MNQNNDLELQSCQEDDPTLPPPRGRSLRRRKINPDQAERLTATHALGGLVPTIITRPSGWGWTSRFSSITAWMCDDPACERIWDNRDAARQCCRNGARRVQICIKCR